MGRHLKPPRKPGSHIVLDCIAPKSDALVEFCVNVAGEPMIHRRILTKKKMGQAFSKKKQKQKAEGLFTQQANFVKDAVQESPSLNNPSEQRNSTPPSPRPHGQILSTLENPMMTTEFLVFLHKLDKADMLEEDECGRADELEFVIAVRQAEAASDEKKAALVKEIGMKYFKQDGLDLDNKELWTRCSRVCQEDKVTETTMSNLFDAHDKCLDKLDSLHMVFLQKYRVQSCTAQIISCLL